MQKIELDIKRSLLALLLLNPIIGYLCMREKFSFAAFVVTSLFLIPLIAPLLKIRQKRKIGLYFSSEGVLYNNGFKEYSSPRNEVRVKVAFNLFIYKEISLILSDKKQAMFALNWITEKDLIKAAPLIPKNHELYKLIETYAKKRNLLKTEVE